jgi:hypothetical protein
MTEKNLQAKRIEGVAGALRTCVRGCRQHEADGGFLTDQLLDGWAAVLESVAIDVNGDAQIEEIARLRASFNTAAAESAEAKKVVAEQRGFVAGLKGDLKRERESLKAIRTALRDSEAKLLSAPPVAQLVAALRVVLMVTVQLRFAEDDHDQSRRMVVGAMDLAQDAMKAAGQIGEFPAGRIAGELALERYRQELERRKEISGR